MSFIPVKQGTMALEGGVDLVILVLVPPLLSPPPITSSSPELFKLTLSLDARAAPAKLEADLLGGAWVPKNT